MDHQFAALSPSEQRELFTPSEDQPDRTQKKKVGSHLSG
jgi:hypothetical protein